jgi:hypothetical protein
MGLLQIEAAKMMGITESTIWNWEHEHDTALEWSVSGTGERSRERSIASLVPDLAGQWGGGWD